MKDTWTRDKDGELIPNRGTVHVVSHRINRSIQELEVKLLQYQALDEEKYEKEIATHKRAIELLKKAQEKEDKEIEILYTPLLHYQIAYLNKGLGINGTRKHDEDAELCATLCHEPKHTYEQWRDMKDPSLKSAISRFIIANSLPKVEKSSEEEQAFQLLQGLV